MKRVPPFSDFGDPHGPFKDAENVSDPLNNFHGTFLTSKGRRKSTIGKGKPMSGAAEAGEAVHSMVQAEFAMRGRLAAAELPIVDIPNQMVSKLDIFTTGGEAIEVKTVSLAELNIMRAPRPEHKMQLIYYLNSMNTGSDSLRGIILYIAREAPGIRKAFEVDKDGEAKQVEGAAIRYMQLRRGGVSETKMRSALKTSIEEQKSPQGFARDYAKYAEEARKLRMRQLNAQKKKLSTVPTNKLTNH
jgi:hypothetical protein